MDKKPKDKIIRRLKSVNKEGINQLICYLETKTDYFEAPASIGLHSNFKGGLALHSHNVVELLLKKNKQYNLNLTNSTIYLTGYLHALYKCNTFKEDIRVRRNSSGEWEGYKTYAMDDKIPLGQGEKSIILIQQFIKLTLEETLMLRWHMGPYVNKEDYKNLHMAMDKYKGVLALFCADIEASYMLEEVRNFETCPISDYNNFIREK